MTIGWITQIDAAHTCQKENGKCMLCDTSTSTVDTALLGHCHFGQEQKHISSSAYQRHRLIQLKIYWVMNGDSYLHIDDDVLCFVYKEKL